MFDFIKTLISPMKLYWGIAGAAIIAGITGIWKYRGFKIEQLEAKVEEAESHAAVTEAAHDNEVRVVRYEATNEEAAKKAIEPVTEYTPKGEVHAKDAAGTFYSI